VTSTDNRLFVEAVLYRYRAGVPWRDLPERFGSWKNVHTRFSRWSKSGVWNKVFTCEQASNPDPTHFGPQDVDVACETGCWAGSQRARVVTPPFLHF